MFTGIVRGVGEIISIESVGKGYNLDVDIGNDLSAASQIKLGNSIAVNGICLTVTHINKSQLSFNLSEETAARTTVGEWQKGKQVNIEPALRVGDELGGHWVTGHIDGCGVIIAKHADKVGTGLNIQAEDELMTYIAEKGSICIDGVSMTINESSKNNFAITIIPWTLKHTTLSLLNEGARINIEVDIIARYAAKINNL